MNTILKILAITSPYIMELIKSKVVPTLKRKTYETISNKTDDLIKDLVQNASKIKSEENEVKKLACLEGTKLGVSTIKAIGEKLIKAGDEILNTIENKEGK